MGRRMEGVSGVWLDRPACKQLGQRMCHVNVNVHITILALGQSDKINY